MKRELFFVNIYPSNDRRLDFDYLGALRDITSSSYSESISHTLITVGDKRIDPWIIAQAGVQLGKNFSPIVAVNPFYIHPLEVAKKIISLNQLFPNPVALNLITGSFFNEMKAVHDNLSLDERSLRLKEFHTVLTSLLKGDKVSFEGRFYQLSDAELFPKYKGSSLKFFVSGALAKEFQQDDNIYYVKSIRPLPEMEKAIFPNSGLLLGICTRPTREEAIAAVKTQYPEDRRGEMLFEISLNNKETPWNVWLKENLAKHEDDYDYYLHPIKNYWSSAPFIVDSYEGVIQKLQNYKALGYNFFMLDYLPDEASHVGHVLHHLGRK
jgi:alkanesulfonate monooxygenase